MLLLYVFLSFLVCNIQGEDYYKLFGVDKDASDREIRRAFKKLAVQLHPDKNPDDSEADSKFMKITRAYEVLKDAELRKRYDQFGDETPSTTNHGNWHSWSYYHDQFGLYDDDPEIVTLSQSEFEQSVLNSRSPWFVNFYSTQCSHCHHLAPTWRQVARTLKGAIRVGAVNCDEDWSLCRSEGIRSYPSLVIYPQRKNQVGDRSESSLINFALSHLSVKVVEVTPTSWDPGLSWLLFLCEEGCVENTDRLLVAAMLTSLVSVGQVDCVLEPAMCDRFSPDASDAILFHRPDTDSPRVHTLVTGTASELADQVLELLPKPISLDVETFQDMLSRLQLRATSCWLVHFDIGAETAEDLEWRRLPALLPGMNLAQVHCARQLGLCNRLYIKRYPTFVLFKPGDASETYHGRISSNDVADFASDSCTSTLVTALDYDTFSAARRDTNSAWLVDFYAPWCPPCLRLLPQLRAASRSFAQTSDDGIERNGAVNFGTVDCTVHEALCRQERITSYPTTVLFNGSNSRNDYHGAHTAQALQEFLEDALDPAVVELSDYSFHEHVGGKKESQLWMVDFFAPWCSPCQQLTPEWRKLAKMLRDLPFVRLGQVDCVKEVELCSNQGVRSYPTIRLYPLGSTGLDTVALFNGYQRDAASLRRWLFFFLPNVVEELTPDKLDAAINGQDPWLVDFYAPWCGHCVAFEPEFIMVAHRLSGRVRCGKVDCQRYRDACINQNVRAYPTVLFIEHRRSSIVSSQSADQIVEFALASAAKVGHDEL